MYFLKQENNKKLLVGLAKSLELFDVHPMASLTKLQKEYKIDSFDKLAMLDPFKKILDDLKESYKPKHGKDEPPISTDELDLDVEYLKEQKKQL